MQSEPINIVDHTSAHIMIVDDEPANLKLLEKMLNRQGYDNLTLIEDPREVMQAYERGVPDIVLLDLNMPHLDGFAVLELLKEKSGKALPPVLVLTAQQGYAHRLRALENGARDYLCKPFDRAELLARVRNLVEAQLFQKYMRDQNDVLEQMVRERMRELRHTRLQIVRRLGRAAEFRDNETGFHILRMSHTSVLLARALGWADEQCELLLHASPMHDVGKIGIPDRILLKPDKLDPEEWEIMKSHVTIGAHILDGDDSALLTLAREIALSHHEKWDGSGYPHGLAGEAIPLSCRIVALADVFDALTSERPYKRAWTVEASLEYLHEQSGQHFDPVLVGHFMQLLPQVLAIRTRFAEP
ncbi:MAG: response regulator [Burkholderiales bacterium]|nr:response regulator [Burkholderiales bacterium]